jgi:hypothetical protein
MKVEKTKETKKRKRRVSDEIRKKLLGSVHGSLLTVYEYTNRKQ